MDTMLWENHWKYCRLLEQELDELSFYIEFHTNNFSCYSLKLMRLINSAVSEFEVVAKQICSEIENGCNTEHYRIGQIRDTIIATYSNILNTKVRVLDMNYELQPFIGWEHDARLEWWDSYNKLKHDRNNNFTKATLKLAIESVAILKVMVMILRNYAHTSMPATTWTLIQVEENWQSSQGN